MNDRRSSKLVTKVHSLPGLACSTPTYAKALDITFKKVSKNTSIGYGTNGWPIIYEVHILYIVDVLSLMAQVNVKNSACPSVTLQYFIRLS